MVEWEPVVVAPPLEPISIPDADFVCEICGGTAHMRSGTTMFICIECGHKVPNEVSMRILMRKKPVTWTFIPVGR